MNIVNLIETKKEIPKNDKMISVNKLTALKACMSGVKLFNSKQYAGEHSLDEVVINLKQMKDWKTIYWLYGQFLSYDEIQVVCDKIIQQIQDKVQVIFTKTPTSKDIITLAGVAESKGVTVERDLLRAVNEIQKIHFGKEPKFLCKIFQYIKTLDHEKILS